MATWEDMRRNFTKRAMSRRSAYVRSFARSQLHVFGHTQGPTGNATEAAALLLLYSTDFEEPAVAPFVRHLKCYAAVRGMNFAVDSKGPRIPHTTLGGTFNISIWNEFFFSARDANSTVSAEADSLLTALRAGEMERAMDLPRVERSLSVSYGDALHFGRAWAVAEHLGTLVLC